MTAAEPTTPAAPISLLRLPAVLQRVGLRKSALYEMVKAGEFPAPIRLGARCSCWPSNAVDAWIADKIARAARTDAQVARSAREADARF